MVQVTSSAGDIRVQNEISVRLGLEHALASRRTLEN